MRSMEDKDPDKMGRNPRRPQVLGIPLLLGLEGPSEDMRRFCSLFTVLKFCLYWSIIYVLEKSLMLGKIEGRRRRGCQRMRWMDSITDAMDMNLSKFRRW